ncbi:hypothetical protein M408DRAFT_333086 [Serendipita vermifera MAFF 305830]|uniref:SCP2 domain-containing protein n=1 Tax=Serendipita vermifera MAFF 305830 TaxID=933852 RepID=A0A0C2W6P6_SERVB|nr:hypothetical protein M408DRAFT_333086 [Serendipita vermifera MAFF 305830]
MSDIKTPGFKASDRIAAIAQAFEAASDAEKKKQIKQVNGVFQFQIKNGEGTEENWTIDLKKEGCVYKGPAKGKADVTIILSDDTFADLADGKLDGQKAFMTGKLKTKGNMMLATKLGPVLAASKPKAKL